MMQLATTIGREFRLMPVVADVLNPCLVTILADLHRLLALAVHSQPRTRVLRFVLHAGSLIRPERATGCSRAS
jgi:hypothetical protein